MKMDCSHSLAPSDEELLQFALEGEALTEKASRHLAQCGTCQQRLAEYKAIHTSLLSRLYRRQCPTGSKLSYYCSDLLPQDERISVAIHLLDCPLCAEEVAVTRRSLAEPQLPPSASFSPIATVRRIFCTLVSPQAQRVMRREAPALAWPRWYRAESIDLSLHLSRVEQGEYILMVIISYVDSAESVDSLEGVAAELYRAPYPPGSEGNDMSWQAETPLMRSQVDDIGNIVFKAVPVGEYVLIVHVPESDMIIEELTIE
jgi:hypothetical protein